MSAAARDPWDAGLNFAGDRVLGRAADLGAAGQQGLRMPGGQIAPPAASGGHRPVLEVEQAVERLVGISSVSEYCCGVSGRAPRP